jgi:hypothetical protein
MVGEQSILLERSQKGFFYYRRDPQGVLGEDRYVNFLLLLMNRYLDTLCELKGRERLNRKQI